jgi:hypothetical protein
MNLEEIYTLGGAVFTGLTALLWAGVALTLVSPHAATVVGSWLLAHGVELAKFRTARIRLTCDMQKLAETMVPVSMPGVTPSTAARVEGLGAGAGPGAGEYGESTHTVTGQQDSQSGEFVGHCTECGWRAVYPTMEELLAASVHHAEYMDSMNREDRGV